jgi:hypothetical protein
MKIDQPPSFRSNFLNHGPSYYDPRWRGTTWVAGHFDPYEVRLLQEEHAQLRWSVFAMQWTQIGTCASIDTGDILKRFHPYELWRASHGLAYSRVSQDTHNHSW